MAQALALPLEKIFLTHNKMSSQSKAEQASRLPACLLSSETSSAHSLGAQVPETVAPLKLSVIPQTRFPSPGRQLPQSSSHLPLSCVDLISFHSCVLGVPCLPWTPQGLRALSWLG